MPKTSEPGESARLSGAAGRRAGNDEHDRTVGFLDLVTAWHGFVTTIGQAVPDGDRTIRAPERRESTGDTRPARDSCRHRRDRTAGRRAGPSPQERMSRGQGLAAGTTLLTPLLIRTASGAAHRRTSSRIESTLDLIKLARPIRGVRAAVGCADPAGLLSRTDAASARHHCWRVCPHRAPPSGAGLRCPRRRQAGGSPDARSSMS